MALVRSGGSNRVSATRKQKASPSPSASPSSDIQKTAKMLRGLGFPAPTGGKVTGARPPSFKASTTLRDRNQLSKKVGLAKATKLTGGSSAELSRAYSLEGRVRARKEFRASTFPGDPKARQRSKQINKKYGYE